MLRDMNETERHNGSPASLFDELPAVEEQQVIAGDDRLAQRIDVERDQHALEGLDLQSTHPAAGEVRELVFGEEERGGHAARSVSPAFSTSILMHVSSR